ncbi:MAG: class I SAM-dependent methyltransferase [Bacteroidales bacterium]|nr:class I SAM-dependent methyltransferase [Bacteroidales bacterium]
MGLLSKIFSNTRKPEGFWWRMMVTGMNGGSHAAMASWGLDIANVPADGEIIDIGCGGGANLARLMDRSLRTKVTGVDYSSVSVEKSRNVNADAIARGRCKVLEASVASLPFKDDTFAMATAFETVYFWPDIEKSFAEVRRIIVPGGKFLIVNEDDGLSGNNEKWEKMIEGMHTYTPDELKANLSAAGFRDIVVHLNESKHWLCAIAIK